MRKWILFSIILAIVIFGILPAVALADNDGGFAVGPAKLEVTVPEDGSSPAYVYITSYLDGELVVGTENLPFRVEPETIPVSATDRNQEVELLIYGDPSLEGGQYSGKITFLFYAGDNVAYGVKLSADITQTSELSGVVPESAPGGVLPPATGGGGPNYLIIGLIAGVVVALAVGIIIGVRLKRPTF
jgi:hypothetical protein